MHQSINESSWADLNINGRPGRSSTGPELIFPSIYIPAFSANFGGLVIIIWNPFLAVLCYICTEGVVVHNWKGGEVVVHNQKEAEVVDVRRKDNLSDQPPLQSRTFHCSSAFLLQPHNTILSERDARQPHVMNCNWLSDIALAVTSLYHNK